MKIKEISTLKDKEREKCAIFARRNYKNGGYPTSFVRKLALSEMIKLLTN